MLGWEFPPHISGGLGTACEGLTRGLSRHGVEVVFVVPKRWGDEDAAHLRLLGCEDSGGGAPVAAAAPPRRDADPAPAAAAADSTAPAPGAAAETGAAVATPARGPRPVATAVRPASVLEVDSALFPYATEEEYLLGLAEGGAAAPSSGTARAGAPEVLAAAAATAASFPGLPELRAEAARRSPARFSGMYGPDLMAEVARYAVAVGEMARGLEVDVVHAHDWMTYPAGVLTARLLGRPLIAHMHATEYDRSGEHPNRRVEGIERDGMHAARLVMPVSHYTAGVVRRRYGVPADRIRVVHNAVSHREQLRDWRVERGIDEPLVLFLGRVTFQKGPDYFLEAAARVVAAEKRVKFVVAGSGDMLARMIERSAELGLARHVAFTGFLRGKDVERAFAQADLYVMPSVSEPFGITPLEAMALDTPAIVSRQSGVSEVLAHALKVDFWNVEELADKILAVLRLPALRECLAENGKAEVLRLHWDKVGERVLQVYREVAA